MTITLTYAEPDAEPSVVRLVAAADGRLEIDALNCDLGDEEDFLAQGEPDGQGLVRSVKMTGMPPAAAVSEPGQRRRVVVLVIGDGGLDTTTVRLSEGPEGWQIESLTSLAGDLRAAVEADLDELSD